MSDHALYELRDAFAAAKDKFCCKKKCSFIMAISLFVLLIILLLLFLWCTPSFRIHFNRGMINYAPNAGMIAVYQPSTLYTWSKLLIGFFLWLTLAVAACWSFKCMKENKALYISYMHKVLMIESYIKMIERGDGGAENAELKQHLFVSMLASIERDPMDTLVKYGRGKKCK